MSEKKKITRLQYLQAQGLWYMANQHHKRLDELDTELNGMLGLDEISHVSDSITMIGDSLDKALKREGIVVMDEVKKLHEV